MITFHHIIARLKDFIISYQLPFNQFTLNKSLVFLDKELSSQITADSFIFCEASVFASCLSMTLPPRICFFVTASGDELPAHIPHNYNYIAFSLDYPVLCTRVMAIYQSYSLYQGRLSRTLSSRQKIEYYMNDLSRLMGAACYLYNEKHQLLLHSRLDLEDDLLDTEFLIEKLEVKNAHTIQDPVYGYYSYLDHQTLLNHTFYLHFVRRKDFSDFDIQWVAREALAHILSGIAEHNIPLYTAAEQSVKQFIEDVMNEAFPSWNEILERYFSLTSSGSLFTTVVYILMPSSADALTHGFFLAELERLFPDCLAGPYGNDVVLFHPNPSKSTRLDLHGLEFTRLLENYSAFAGCSMWTKFRFRTSIIMAQANATFGKNLRLSTVDRIFYHNDYSIYHLIDLAAASYQQVHHTRDLTYLIHPCILRINQYDHQHHTNLLEVLYYYLINGCSVNETASQMNMHRNTIQGKLNRLNELISDDYTRNGLIQCRLLLSCMLFFYQIRYLKTPFLRHQSVESSFTKLGFAESNTP